MTTLKTNSAFRRKAAAETIEEYEHLVNGLRVLYVPIPGCNAVVSNVVYLVGSRHELPGKTGIAHMLEHMMFKETIDRAGKRAKVPRHITLQNKGATLNANTWTDRTCYYYVLPPEYLGEVLSAEAERMRGLVLTDKEFSPEQKNVLSEFEMYASRPDFVLSSTISEHAFVSHGYGHETIGFKSDIEGLTCADLKEFYDTYYWPNNAYLIVAGDIGREEVLDLVDAHFGHIPRSPYTIPSHTVVEPPRTYAQTITIKKNNPFTLTTLSYRAPRMNDPMWVVGTVALAYLSAGKIAPLYRKLVEMHKASSVHASLMPFYDPSMIAVDITVAKGTRPEEVHAIVHKEIARLQTHPLTAKDLQRVQNKIIADTLYARDGVEAVAHELTEYIAGGNWQLYTTTVADIKKVTPEDIQEFARTYLQQDTVLTGILQGTA